MDAVLVILVGAFAAGVVAQFVDRRRWRALPLDPDRVRRIADALLPALNRDVVPLGDPDRHWCCVCGEFAAVAPTVGEMERMVRATLPQAMEVDRDFSRRSPSDLLKKAGVYFNHVGLLRTCLDIAKKRRPV